MRKMKLLFTAVAVVAAIGHAVAMHSCAPCEYATQYILSGGQYIQAGELGTNFICWGDLDVCTYWRPHAFAEFTPCHYGTYIALTP